MEQPQTVLLIDDDPEVLETATSYLSQHGFQVFTTSLWTEAIAHLQATPPDLVLLDLTLPTVQGETLLEFIREQDQNLPVVILTSGIDAEKIEHLGKLHANGFIRKPFDVDDLLVVVEQALIERENLATATVSATAGQQVQREQAAPQQRVAAPLPRSSGPKVSPGAGVGALPPQRQPAASPPARRRRTRKKKTGRSLKRIRNYVLAFILFLMIGVVVWAMQNTLSAGFFGIGF